MMCLAVSLKAQEWEQVTAPTENNISGVTFPNPDTGYFVTQAGELGFTFDGGRNWRMLPIELGVVLEDVHFLNTRLGLACGRDGAIYRTTNGGRTWENHSLTDTLPLLLSIRLVTEKNAVAVGMSRETDTPLRGISLVSADGGQTWTRQESMGLGYGELFAVPGGPVYFQSYGQLHMSRDGGATWRTIRTVDGKPGRATAIYGGTGILVGNAGMTAHSSDKGKTWEVTPADVNLHLTSVVLVNADTGYAGSVGGQILMTTDGGATWENDPVPGENDIYDLALAGDDLFAVGREGYILRKKVR
jgi:photosystem II stability/assembly factor-like uncharacterized protein